MPSQVTIFSPVAQDFHSFRQGMDLRNSTKCISLSKTNNSLNPFLEEKDGPTNNLNDPSSHVNFSNFRNNFDNRMEVDDLLMKVNKAKDIPGIGHGNSEQIGKSNNLSTVIVGVPVLTPAPSAPVAPVPVRTGGSHICDIYCTECEIAAKKSRTLLLSTGGDVIINSSINNFSGQCTNWMESSGSSSTTSHSASSNNCCSFHRNSVVTASGGEGKSNFSVKLDVPMDFRTQKLVININIENKKITDDLNVISRNLSQLKESGWYYEAMNYQDAQNLLGKSETGTFLLRNSSDSRFLFSLSCQTDRGPTSVRINYVDGKFQFDADKKFNDVLPKVDSVIGLLEHHVQTAQYTGQVWVEPNGRRYSPVVLSKPLKKNVPTLQHLCRVSLNNSSSPSSSQNHHSNAPSITHHHSFRFSTATGTTTTTTTTTSSKCGSSPLSNGSEGGQGPLIAPGIKKYLSEYPYRL